MKRLPVLVVTLLVVGVLTAVTAVGVGLADRDDSRWTRMGPMMMGSSTVDSEPEYLAEMVAHHREAVAAARELARSERPRMRAFGESIVETQSAQVEQMTAWLADRYPDVSTTVDYRPMMRDLSGLSGDDLDRAFLQDMIGHHMVAVMMSQHLLLRGTNHEDLAQLARSIRDEQHAEVVEMQRWLARWFNADWRGGMGGGMGPAGCSGRETGPGMMSGLRS